ncbi:hypothetical protein OED01_13380 [Microbacterium sp. M28]|uniref:hypothetical protein n=1 Tax=Microbacterium sp. M28 TaxID=2962064 RepID=UPI0021F4DA6E|nr:hypothetical protein [Microbacterium sp. M28]UYO96586.1 hypothetical protein OED01_13380 [Microbacterium sp. M28]
MALQAGRMLRVVRYARRHPELFVDGIEDAEAIDHAERAAVLDLALRMNMSEEHVRGQVFLAERALVHLPGLWERAVTGFASLYLVGRAVHALGLVAAPADATAEERAAERAAFAAIDAATAEWAGSCSPASFNRRLKRLTDRLCPVPAEAQHARAMRDRRVYVEDTGGGMAWFHALIPTLTRGPRSGGRRVPRSTCRRTPVRAAPATSSAPTCPARGCAGSAPTPR